MGTVHIGIRHYYYLAVAKLAKVKILTYARSKGCDNGGKLVVAVDTVDTGFFHVEHLSPKGKYSLEPSVSALFCRAACGISLDDIYFRDRCVTLRAVSELAGQA